MALLFGFLDGFGWLGLLDFLGLFGWRVWEAVGGWFASSACLACVLWSVWKFSLFGLACLLCLVCLARLACLLGRCGGVALAGLVCLFID